MQAKGAGITGGDPLVKLERTCRYIKKLKEAFGKEFHIHLYTSLRLVTEDALQQIYQAGLDEIRFHPDLDSPQFWKRIEIAQKFPWDIGVEIPLIPGKEKETKELIDYIPGKVKFLNLNELETADNQVSKLLEMNFEVKDELSYAVKGSLEMGLDLIAYVQENILKKNYSLNVHLCTAKLKDAVQLANRIKNEAKGAKKSFDEVDEEGMLIRGALYLPELAPGFEYRKKLAEIDKTELLEKLKVLREKILLEAHLREKELFLDEEKPRLLLSRKNLMPRKKMFLSLGLLPAMVTEYPTADQLEIEVEFLQ